MNGQTISRYPILDKPGEDGMGDVYEAGGERFEREARAISSFNHSNIRALLPRPALRVVLIWTAGPAG